MAYELAGISDWVVGGGITSPKIFALQKGDVVWLRYDYFEAAGEAYAQLNWDRPDGSGGTITNQPIPGSVMFLSESLARGFDRTESVGQDTSGLGFQLFANQSTQSLLNVRLEHVGGLELHGRDKPRPAADRQHAGGRRLCHRERRLPAHDRPDRCERRLRAPLAGSRTGPPAASKTCLPSSCSSWQTATPNPRKR